MTAKSQATKIKLISSASTLFQQKGFLRTTIREIADAAGTNLAAINYHFGDKNSLFRAMLFGIAERLAFLHGPMPKHDPNGPPARDQFKAFVRWFIELGVRTGEVRRMGLEMGQGFGPGEDGPMTKEILDRFVKPAQACLHEHLDAIAGEPLPDEIKRRIALSVIGQVSIYGLMQPAIKELYDLEGLPDPECDALVEQITIGVVAGIDELRQSGAIG